MFVIISGKGYIEEKDFTAVLTKYWKPVNSEDDIVDAFKVELYFSLMAKKNIKKQILILFV